MKKFLPIFLFVGVIVFGINIGSIAEAATSDTFNITITVNYFEMQIVQYDQAWDGTAYTAWAIGNVATSSSTTMTEAQGVKVVLGTTSQTIDIQTHVSNEGSSWTVGASSAADVYAILAKGYAATQGTPSATGGTQLTTSAQDVVGGTSIASAASTWIYYQFDTPTSVSTGAQQTIEITLAIVAS